MPIDPKPPTLDEILTAVQSGFERVNADIAIANANLGLVSSDLCVVKDRVALVEERQHDFDDWRKRSSERVRGTTSSADLENSANLSREIVARNLLEEKVNLIDAKQNDQLALLDTLVKVTRSPLVRQAVQSVFTVLVGAFVAWLALKLGVVVK